MTDRTPTWPVTAAVLLLVATACGDAGPTEPPPSRAPSASSVSPSPSTDPTDAAIADLTHRLSVEADAVTVVSREEVVWRNGAMGCPEPGMSYTQALVDGYRVVLEVDGRRYHYHGRVGGEPFLCEDPAKDATAS